MTQNELKKILAYDPLTGVFTWIAPRNNRYAKAGAAAGYERENGYIRINIAGKLYYAHRLAVLYMTGEFPTNDTDHVNGTRSDNRWVNLRAATRSQNLANKVVSSSSATGVKGVVFNRTKKKYVVNITVNGVQKYLGRFSDIEVAQSVYESAAKELQGEFYPATRIHQQEKRCVA